MDQVKSKIPRCGAIDPKTVITHDFCYQCVKYGPDVLFLRLRIRDKTDEPFSSVKKKFPDKYYTKTMFQKDNEKLKGNRYE